MGDVTSSTSSLCLQYSEWGPAISPFPLCPLKLKSLFHSTQSDKTGNGENCCIQGGGCHCQVHNTRDSRGSSRRNCHTRSNAPHSGTGDDFLLVWKSLLRHVTRKPSTFSSRLLIITLLFKISPPIWLSLSLSFLTQLPFRLLLTDYNSSQCLPMDVDSSIQGTNMHVLSLSWNSVYII